MDQVGKQVGQTFVIENRPGAGGTTGANAVAKAAPDGATILTYGAMAGSAALYSKLPYDPLERFHPGDSARPAAGGGRCRSARGGGKRSAIWLPQGKARPGALNVSTAGIGSASHFGAERLRVSAGFEAQQVAFRGMEWSHGNHRRSCRFQRAAVLQRAGADQGGQAGGARHQRRQAHRRFGGRADDRRGGPAAGFGLPVLHRECTRRRERRATSWQGFTTKLPRRSRRPR